MWCLLSREEEDMCESHYRASTPNPDPTPPSGTAATGKLLATHHEPYAILASLNTHPHHAESTTKPLAHRQVRRSLAIDAVSLEINRATY